MPLFLIILIAVVIAIAIYVVIHYEITKHATLIVRKDAQETTDKAMKASLPILVNSNLLLFTEINFDQSETVADVWGRGVMAFEYILPVQDVVNDDLPLIKELLNRELTKYGYYSDVDRVAKAKTPFLVTDAWLYEQTLHLDIAYLMNDATYEYVHDLKKLN